MKKILSIFMAILMCFLMAGCGAKDSSTDELNAKEAFSPDSFLRNAADFLSELEEANLYAEGFTADMLLTLSATKEGKAFLADVAEIDEEYINWLDTVAVDTTIALKDNEFSLAAIALLNSVDLLSLDIAFDGNTMYISLPEYSDKAISGYIPELDGMSFAAPNFLSYVDLSLLQSVLDNYLNIVADNVKFEENTVNKTASGISAELTEYELKMDSNLLLAICNELVPAMQEDKDLEKLIYQFSDYFNEFYEYSGTDYYYVDGYDVYSEFTDALDDFSEDMAEYDKEEDNYEIGTFSLYSDKEGNFAGFNFTGEDDETIELLNIFSGNDYGFEFVAKDEYYTMFEISGEGVKNENTLDAEFTIYSEEEELYTFYTKNLDLEQFAKGSLCGEFEFPLSEIIGYGDFALHLDLYETDTEAEITMTLLDSEDTLFTLKAEAEISPDAKIAIPYNAIDSEDTAEVEKWAQSVFIKLASDLLSKLEEANVPKEFIDMITESLA